MIEYTETVLGNKPIIYCVHINWDRDAELMAILQALLIIPMVIRMEDVYKLGYETEKGRYRLMGMICGGKGSGYKGYSAIFQSGSQWIAYTNEVSSYFANWESVVRWAVLEGKAVELLFYQRESENEPAEISTLGVKEETIRRLYKYAESSSSERGGVTKAEPPPTTQLPPEEHKKIRPELEEEKVVPRTIADLPQSPSKEPQPEPVTVEWECGKCGSINFLPDYRCISKYHAYILDCQSVNEEMSEMYFQQAALLELAEKRKDSPPFICKHCAKENLGNITQLCKYCFKSQEKKEGFFFNKKKKKKKKYF